MSDQPPSRPTLQLDLGGFNLGRFARRVRARVQTLVQDTIPSFLDEELNADKVLRKTMSSLIDAAAARYPVDAGAQWQPGTPLELLLVGYSGTRNTGADVRVEEMIRQFRFLLGDANLRLSILTLDPEKTRGYFAGVRQLSTPKLFPKFLFDVVHQHHGVIACEGSMFKSKFANALTTFMVGALGLAGAEQKLAIGYGGEAGQMDPDVEAMVRRYGQNSLIIARNKASIDVLRALEIEASLGADTAWTFEPAAPEVGRDLLLAAGWDGQQPVVVCCPINPFWWPVQADWRRGVEQALFKNHGQSHFSSVYFHASSPEIDAKQLAYIEALATGLEAAKRQHNAFIALVGMEALDRRAAEALARRLDAAKPTGTPETPLFISDTYEHRTLVAILRQASALVSSRYHAIVTSMPTGVPAVGVTMDERIRNLLGDAGLADLILETADPELGPKLTAALDRTLTQPTPIRHALRRDVSRQLYWMGVMGRTFVDAIRRHHPAFPLRPELGGQGDPFAHLPPLSAELTALLAEFPPPTDASVAATTDAPPAAASPAAPSAS